jgi:threonine synthase
MNYISTRGDSKKRTFSQAVLEGLADDGGLLIPESLPDLSSEWPKWGNLEYHDLAYEVLRPLATDLSEQTLRECCRSAYGPSYGGPVAPLRRVGDFHLLELFHGPTLAFKDVALQLLGRLFGVILEERDLELNIVAATSGDTGSAAIHGMKDVPRVRLFVTHPDGRIAPLQRRQMTTVVKDSVFNIAVSGTFDDCQQMVKELSRDLEFKRKHNIGAVNSINFARIAAQVVYYFAAYLQTPGASQKVPAVVAVPTGNFGNILAAEYARRMGLPLHCTVLASNENDILPQFFKTGVYKRGTAQATHSPAMDIQVASNFERYLYLLAAENAHRVKDLMAGFAAEGQLQLPEGPTDGWRALACTNEKTLETVKSVWEQHNHLLDPHTATAWWALQQCQDEFDPALPKIVVGTAHPAKFPDVLKAVVPNDAPALTDPTLEALGKMPERLFHLAAQTMDLKEFVSKGIELGAEGVFLRQEEKAAPHG